MARRGGGRRTYVRDANGRFASTPGGVGRAKKPQGFRRSQAVKLAEQRGQTGRLGAATKAARASLRASKAKLTPGASRQQKAAVSRARNMAIALSGRKALAPAQSGRLKGVKVPMASGRRVKPGQKPYISRAEPLTSGKGTLPSRSSLTRAKKNLATNPTPAQKGAVTRANRYAMQSRMKNVGSKRIEPGPGQMRKRPAFERPARWDTKVGPTTAKATPIKPRVPASQRPGSITNTLKNTLRSLAQSDAKRIREIEAITGQPVRAPKKPPAGSGATVRPSGRRSVSGTLRDSLRSLAKSDARYYRELADLTKAPPAKGLKGGKGQGRAIGGQKKALAGSKPRSRRKP